MALGFACVTVVPDYIIDCIPSGKPPTLKYDKPYTLNRVIQRLRLSKKKQRNWRNNFEEGVKASKEIIDSSKAYFRRCDGVLTSDQIGLHHIFYDQTGFEYKIVCSRVNEHGSAKVEKYTIYVRTLLRRYRLHPIEENFGDSLTST